MDGAYKTASITAKDCGTCASGRPVRRWYLANRHGMRAEVLDLGGVVHRLVAVGGDLKKHDVVLGAQDAQSYVAGAFAPAALRGCGAGPLPAMEAREEGRQLVMRHRYDQGPWAGVEVALRFALTEDCAFAVEREVALAADAPRACVELPGAGAPGAAEAPAPGMPLYLNLAGQEPGNVLDHAVAVDAPAWEDGARHPVEGTAADYRGGKLLADGILLPECLGGPVAGFDWRLLIERPAGGEGVAGCATVYCARSRLYLDVATDAEAVRLTTFQPRDGRPVAGKNGLLYGNHSGFCLEGAPRGATVLKRGDRLRATTAYRFTPDYPDGYHTDSGCLDRIL